MGALVEALPQFVLGGAGLVMFGMVAATGIRILSGVDYKGHKNNLFHRRGVDRRRHDPAGGSPPGPSTCRTNWRRCSSPGILLTTLTAVVLNLFFNGAKGSVDEAKQAAMQAEGGH